MRIEKDALGKVTLADTYPFGIHTKRAERNFKFTDEVMNILLFQSVLRVKQACARANMSAGLLDENIGQAIDAAVCRALDEGIVPSLHPFQGGAGTSINMAANELLANYALESIGYSFGEYEVISPLNHVNMSQSTNDVFLTAVKCSLLVLLKKLHASVESTVNELQKKEREFSGVLKIGRTELQDALPLSVGQEFGAWAESLSRFRWRLSKAFDWIREVNLGGTAVGTGINADSEYRAVVLDELRNIVKEPLTRARNMVDATQNGDAIVEIAGLVKTGAVAVKKMASDWRLLSSGPQAGFGELRLPALQSGSSIMPGKVNPVLAEAAEQVALEVMSADARVSIAVAESNLELQQFLPYTAHVMLSSLDLFAGLMERLTLFIPGIDIHRERVRSYVEHSYAVATLLAPSLGYETVDQLLQEAKKEHCSFVELVVNKGYLTREEVNRLMTPEVMASPGLPIV